MIKAMYPRKSGTMRPKRTQRLQLQCRRTVMAIRWISPARRSSRFYNMPPFLPMKPATAPIVRQASFSLRLHAAEDRIFNQLQAQIEQVRDRVLRHRLDRAQPNSGVILWTHLAIGPASKIGDCKTFEEWVGSDNFISLCTTRRVGASHNRRGIGILKR
jgi:hypothetical protein